MVQITSSAKHVGRAAAALAFSAALLVPGATMTGVSAQERLPATASAAPEDAVLFYELDLDFEGSQWKQTEALLDRVGIPNALDLWRDEMLSEGASSGEFTAADLDALVGGELAIVVTPTAVQRMLAMHEAMARHGHDAKAMKAESGATPVAQRRDEPMGISAILQPGDPEAAWDYVVRQTNALAERRGIELMVASGPGEDLIWSESTRKDGHSAWEGDPLEEMFGHHGKGDFAIGHSGGYIVAAENPADVTSILDVIDGTTPSLAESESALDIASRLPEDAISFAYINATAIMDSLDPAMAAAIQSVLPSDFPPEALGGHAGISLSADENGFRFDSVSVPVEGVDLSAYMVQNDPGVAAQAANAPAGTFIFSAGKLPPNAFAGAAFGLAQAVNDASTGEWTDDHGMAAIPTAEEMEAQIAQATETLGFNPESDLFDLLGDEYIAFTSFPSLSFESFGIDAVAAIATSDPAALSQTMEKIAAWGDRAEDEVDVSIRRVGTDTIYVVADPSMAEGPSLEFGVLDDRAVMAIGNGLDQLSSPPTDVLADDAQFQEVMGLLPSEYYQVSYIDFSQAMAPIMMLTGEFSNSTVRDADLACGEFETQALAQDAFDADPVGQSDLDQDFDGVACEDAFGDATASTAPAGSLANIRALGMVSFQAGESVGASAILYIAEPGS